MNTSTQLSPLRKTTKHEQAEALAIEQAQHFGIDPNSEYGMSLVELATTLYKANNKTHDLWAITVEGLSDLDKSDRIAWFNAKRFLSFQIAKILDNLQNPMRATYQSIATNNGNFASKGHTLFLTMWLRSSLRAQLSLAPRPIFSRVQSGLKMHLTAKSRCTISTQAAQPNVDCACKSYGRLRSG